MEQILPYLEGLSLAGVSALAVWFAWWKRNLKKEIVEPDVLLIYKDITRIYARLTKVEDKCERLDMSVDKKLDALNDTVREIVGNLAELSGQLKVLTNVVHNGTKSNH